MPRTAQIYNLFTRPNTHIHDRLMEAQEENIEITKLNNRDRNDLTYVIHVTTDIEDIDEVLEYCVHFNINRRKVFIIGRSDGRARVENLINTILHEGDIEAIGVITLEPQTVIDEVFYEILRGGIDSNRIHKLTCIFRDPENGFPYHRNNYARLDYQLFGENTCGSTHRDFDRFIQNSVSIKIRFVLGDIPGLLIENNPIKVDLALNMAFRLFTDRTYREWIVFLNFFNTMRTL